MIFKTFTFTGARPAPACKMALVVQDDGHWNQELLRGLNDNGICGLIAHDWDAALDLLKTAYIRLILIHRPLSEAELPLFVSWLYESSSGAHVFFLFPQNIRLDHLHAECRQRLHEYYNEPLQLQSLSSMIYQDYEPQYHRAARNPFLFMESAAEP